LPSSRPILRLEEIVDNIEAIEEYVADLSFDDFQNDRKTRDAVERCLSRVSEAAVKLGEAAEIVAPGPPWANIRGYGNRLRHTYDGVQPLEVWNIVNNDLPLLKAVCQTAAIHLLADGNTPKSG